MLSAPGRLALAAVFAVVFAVAFLLVPVYTIPGNTLEFWLAIAPWWTYVFLAVYSLGMGLSAAMMAYVFQFGGSATAAGGVVPTLLSGFYSTAACGSCLAGTFAFLGSGTTLFLAEHQYAFMTAGLFLTVASLYFLSKKVNKACESCRVTEGKRK